MINLHHLTNLFNPTSIAIIGASTKEKSIGGKVFGNVIAGDFAGAIYPVNPKYKKIHDLTCYASVNDIKSDIDLAIIVTPAVTVPDIMKNCGEKGVKSVIIISSGFSEIGEEGKALEKQVIDIAHQYGVRVIGPNCLGLMRPALKLNATFDDNFPLEGDIALVSQSGAICAAILDWANSKKIGFSTILSLGNGADVDFGDLLDYLSSDPKTKSIMLYIEGIHDAQGFMQGLRTAAEKKPVIVIKAGRNSAGSRAVHSHTGALIGDDDVFAAALRRGGAIRVDTIGQLFSAAEVLSSNKRVTGDRLIIITNGGGAGVLAADHATALNVTLTTLSDTFVKNLDTVLPAQWSHQNPIDILGDATPERYANVVASCINNHDTDGVLVMLVPVAVSEPTKVAEEVIASAKSCDKPVLACWLGADKVKRARQLFAENHLPCFSTPEPAVEAFSYLVEYHRNQQLLMQKPEIRAEVKYDHSAVRRIFDLVMTEKREILTTVESKAVLTAFGIPIDRTIEAKSPEEAVEAAESLGFPIVMKISSPDITHKQDAGGVKLNIMTADQVANVFNQIISNAKKYKSDAKIIGVTVEKMQTNPNNREVLIGVIQDKVFGPVITFGAGGSLVEILHDRAIALPPINTYIAKQMIAHTRIAKMLGDFRSMPAVNMDALVDVLLRISDLVQEFPEISELDINPLLVNDKTVIAVDTRIVIAN